MRRSVAVVSTIALALAACGGEDDALSPQEFRSELNRICRDDTKAAKRFSEPLVDDKEYGRQLRGLLDINAQSRDRLDALEPPEELRAAYEEFLAANDEGVELTRDIADRLERGQKRQTILTGTTAKRVLEIGRRRAAAAERLGTPACGSNV